MAFLAHDAEAIWHVRGAWGEDNTRDELQRAKRKRLVWAWVDSVTLQAGDIDHLVVTRNGGLVAIDSKWRSKINDAADMARAAQKVRLRAEGLTRDLLKGDAGHPTCAGESAQCHVGGGPLGRGPARGSTRRHVRRHRVHRRQEIGGVACRPRGPACRGGGSRGCPSELEESTRPRGAGAGAGDAVGRTGSGAFGLFGCVGGGPYVFYVRRVNRRSPFGIRWCR
ncbi:nuclease-related domain-containing protein [Nocardioides ochotonae]|uniref:nuclease-related domain-containing protein n=1 Tax=Nocardioides ochotonae TaxID=2685869 RepID=UPI0014073A32